MTSKAQPWLPSLHIWIFPSSQLLTAVFAGGRRLGGCFGCACVSWSSVVASCLLLLTEDLGSGQRRCKSVAGGFAVTQVYPCLSPTLPIAWQGVAEMTVATGWGVCWGAAVESVCWLEVAFFSCCWKNLLVHSQVPWASCWHWSWGGWGRNSSDHRLFGWPWINWACSSCWSWDNFCYQPLGKKGWLVACTANILGLVSGEEQSKTQWFVGIESQQQCNGPASKAAVVREAWEDREGELQLSNVRCYVLLENWNKIIPGLKSELAISFYEAALGQNWKFRNSEVL